MNNAGYHALLASSSALPVALGLVALVVRAWRGPSWLPRLILTWAIVPVVLISIGTSKLYHYMYPFIPPLMLGVGLAAAMWWDLSEPALARFFGGALATRGMARRRWVRRVLVATACVAVALAVWVAFAGSLTLAVHGVRLFRSSTPFRPLAVAAVLFWCGGVARTSARAWSIAVLAVALPVFIYPRTIEQFASVRQPLHVLRDCMLRLTTSDPNVRRGVYVPVSTAFGWPYYYYLRSTGPWVDDRATDLDREVATRLFVSGRQTPILLDKRALFGLATRTEQADAQGRGVSSALDWRWDDVKGIQEVGARGVVLLPGPYAACIDPVVDAGGQKFSFSQLGLSR